MSPCVEQYKNVTVSALNQYSQFKRVWQSRSPENIWKLI